MRKFIGLAVFGILAVALPAPAQTQEENAPLLSGLVVRATQGGQPVEDLGLVDFELSIGGRKIALESMAFVRDNTVERREGPTYVEPPDRRRIDFVFDVTHFTPSIEAALKDFMLNAFRPGDELTIRTLKQTYTLSPYALEAKSREALAEEIIAAVHRDVEVGAALYDDILTGLRQLAVALGGSKSGAALEMRLSSTGNSSLAEAMDRLIPRYRDGLEKLQALRNFDNLMRGATAGPAEGPVWAGPKITLFFFEHTFLPVLSDDVLTALSRVYQDRNPKVRDDVDAISLIFQNKEVPDETHIRQFFSRADDELCLIGIPAKVEDAGEGTMKPFGEDYFDLIGKVAAATGGTVLSAEDPAAAVPKIMNGLGTYYILFYKPLPAAKEGGAGVLAVSVGLKRRTADLSYRQYDYSGRG